MATKYDTWLADVPYDPEGEWAAERASAIEEEIYSTSSKLEAFVEDALADDGENAFARMLADFFVAIQLKRDNDTGVYGEAFFLRGRISHHIESKIAKASRTIAQAEWDNRQVGAPE